MVLKARMTAEEATEMFEAMENAASHAKLAAHAN